MRIVLRGVVPCLVLALVLVAAGCDNGSSGNTIERVSLAYASVGELNIEMLTDTRLETGLTPVYVKLSDAKGRDVTDADVTVVPLMYMSDGKNHTAPLYGPPAVDENGYYRCDVVFQMPTSDTGYWDMKVVVEQPGADPVETTFQKVVVADSGRSVPFLYADPETKVETKYIVSLNFDAAQKVGLNPVLVTVNQKVDMWNFPPVDGLTITLDPQMPSMGHGSPGSVNPRWSSPGQYRGELSLSMAGPWETTVTLKKGDVTLGAPVFKFTF